MKKKILIIGSSGMLGSALCKILNGEHHIFGIDLKKPQKTTNFFKCDITKFKDTREIFLKVMPDIVIHTAAFTDVDGCEKNVKVAKRINIQGTINVVRAVNFSNSFLFFISTDYVFDGKKKRAYRENDRPRPLNTYGKTKLEAEQFIQNNLDNYFIIRTSWLYGKGGKNFVDTIIDVSRKKHLLEVVNDQIGSPTYVVDLAYALREIVKKPDSFFVRYAGIYHITNSEKCSWYEFAKEIIRLKRLKVKIVPIKSKDLDRPAKRPKNSTLDNSKFNRLINKPMRSWKKAIVEYLNVR
jgi:dTDP-4-dehydrorhamnose reductase